MAMLTSGSSHQHVAGSLETSQSNEGVFSIGIPRFEKLVAVKGLLHYMEKNGKRGHL